MEGVQLNSEVDRISVLPDFIIQHILSFLPSTKESIRTGILSKRWRDQWTRVPVLILKSSDMSQKNFIKYTENVLLTYDSFKIKKFYLHYDLLFQMDPNFSAKVRFATRRNVEELSLECFCNEMHMLPEFLFKHGSLVKLHTVSCIVAPNKEVNWECLKELSLLDCQLSNKAIESVLSGSPLLEFLKLWFYIGIDKLSVLSNSLKRVVVVPRTYLNEVTEISCPILEELTICRARVNRAFGSPRLKSVELCSCDCSGELSITSESLRRLVLKEIKAPAINISCPNLKELKLEDLKDVGTLELKDVPSSISSASNLTINWAKGSVQWCQKSILKSN